MEAIVNKPVNYGSKLCCRACLNTDCKLFNIHDNNLADAFACISGIAVSRDHLPQHLCACCSSLMIKYMSLRMLCINSYKHLMTGLLERQLLIDNTNASQQRKTFYNLAATAVEIVDCIAIKQESTIVEDIDTIANSVEFKIEAEDYKADIDNVMNKVLEDDKITDDGNKNESDVKGFVENRKDVKRGKRNVEVKGKKNLGIDDGDYDDDSYDDDDVIDNIDHEEFASVKGKVEGKKRKIVKKKNINLDYYLTIDCKGETKDDKQKNLDDSNDLVSVKAKPVKEKRSRRKQKAELKKKFRSPANDYLPPFDFATFEKAYSVTVVTLTKEEQLAEIEERKTSDNYKECPFRCEDCGKGFVLEAAFNNHRARHSPNDAPHACEICSMRFKKLCQRQIHQDSHRLKFLCKECDYVSRNRWQARGHHGVHAGKTFSCKYCGKTFTKASTHLSHVRIAHPAMNVACEICGETFIGATGLRQHKSRSHSETVKPTFNCPSCPAKFKSSEALDRHTDTTEEHAGLRPCEQCGENCASEQELQLHVGEKHAVESLRCEECNQTFSSEASYALHHRRKHLNEKLSFAGQKITRPRPGPFVCEQCGRILPSATLFTYHLRSHLDVKPFPCSHCPKTFATARFRRDHERSHTGEKPYQCDQCELTFSLRSNLSRHHKSVHLGIRPRVPCPVCGRELSSPAMLRAHLDTQHKGLPGPKRLRKKKKE